MRRKSIVIRVSNDLIYFNPNFHIPIEATNIPKKHLKFRTNYAIYWLVELIKYDNSNNTLEVKICNYKASNSSNVKEQTPTKEMTKKFKEHKKSLELTITNFDIREEFDAVKNYFAKVLRTKKIEVTVFIEITDNQITYIEIKSPEIEKIDNQFIDNVKLDFIKSTTKKKLNVESDKNLFTIDEYFEAITDEKIKSNTFYNNDTELFEDLLKISNKKHYKHLRFLSSKHSQDLMKLRFVLKPLSFIFLIEGDRNYHVVWETLDTEEATYVWHNNNKDINLLKPTLQKIEDIINLMKVQGKATYLSSTEDEFRRIYHDYSNDVNGFINWKEELEGILI